MRALLKRWGRSALKKEKSPDRLRQGTRVDESTSVLFLVPADTLALRSQLKDLVDGLNGYPELGEWKIVADTGLTQKAHAKARAQRIRSLEAGQSPPSDFPQHGAVQLFWRDEVASNGLPKVNPNGLGEGDVLIYLGQSGDNLTLKALLKRSTIAFKVGPAGLGLKDLDFMLTWPEEADMSSFVQLALHYLKTLDLK